ncbi:molybdopterin-guanine dinucleotide biosynthesis protein MobB [Erwinia mallotivora]|uniref:Molybdopterin-guanine dinucleotide biosynthesis protein B n=1 Tax=Erwinia mallotivora TaxID=69222 RepID=A0A014M775_9GAMM|nr:molybdopterin-guanine dinucleotide biosynthesis protein MobB [Erwinia mallotivora]EXU73949.1 molybdopterin-guanine dinucleotide biosynthesis protein B [Erwinia mallotivora]
MIPLLAITAFSGTGKTTLLKQLITIFKTRGIRPGLIKHTHHDMDIDIPGKDSYELRKAGASQVMVFNSQRWALVTEMAQQPEPDLQFLVSRMDQTSMDIILLEGFRHEPVPKIALWRGGEQLKLAQLLDRHVIAVASDRSIPVTCPLLDLNDPPQIADFIAAWLRTRR